VKLKEQTAFKLHDLVIFSNIYLRYQNKHAVALVHINYRWCQCTKLERRWWASGEKNN